MLPTSQNSLQFEWVEKQEDGKTANEDEPEIGSEKNSITVNAFYQNAYYFNVAAKYVCVHFFVWPSTLATFADRKAFFFVIRFASSESN